MSRNGLYNINSTINYYKKKCTKKWEEFHRHAKEEKRHTTDEEREREIIRLGMWRKKKWTKEFVALCKVDGKVSVAQPTAN